MAITAAIESMVKFAKTSLRGNARAFLVVPDGAGGRELLHRRSPAADPPTSQPWMSRFRARRVLPRAIKAGGVNPSELQRSASDAAEYAEQLPR